VKHTAGPTHPLSYPIFIHASKSITRRLSLIETLPVGYHVAPLGFPATTL
jgi:hypothetical protein